MNNNEDQFSLDDYAEGNMDGFGASTASPIRGTVRHGKVEYAVDLQWESPQDPAKVVKEAREHASNQTDRADYYCVRKGVKTQFGLGFSALGHKTNLPSLAAHICQNKGASFVGLFEVDGGYYLIAVRDDNILSDAERFIETLSEASNVLNGLLREYDFPEVIAPDSLEIDGSRYQTLASVLSGSTNVRLKDVKQSGNYIKWALAGAVAVIAIFGVRYYWDQAEQERLMEDARLKFEQAQTMTGLAEPKIEIPPMPWDGQLMGARVLETCFNEIQKFPLDLPGWNIGAIDCKPVGSSASVGVVISRDKSLDNAGSPILDAMQMVKFNGINPNLQGKSAGSAGPFGFEWSVGGNPKIPVDIETAKISEITDAMLMIMESRHTEVSFSPADTNDFWTGVNIEFRTSLSPVSFADVLDAIPGFMLTSLEYDIENNVYTVKGKAYEQKPLPQNAAQR